MALTVWVFGQHWLVGCQWLGHAHLVLGAHLYQVLSVLQQVLQLTGLGLGAEFLHLSEARLLGLTLLYDVVCDLAATVVFGWFP